LLLLGVVYAWVAVLAGEVAKDIARPGLCRSDVLEQHKSLVYSTAILFSIALFFDFGKTWIKNPRGSFLITVAVSILSCGIADFDLALSTRSFACGEFA
jgi:uncharacterized membrane protein